MKTLKDLGWDAESLPESLVERMGSAEQALKLTPRQAVREMCGWYLGDPDWANEFESFVETFGGKIIYSEETHE